MKQFNKTG